MTTISRLGQLDHSRRKTLIGVAAAILLIALSIPLGLHVLNKGGLSSTGPGAKPASGQADGSAGYPGEGPPGAGRDAGGGLTKDGSPAVGAPGQGTVTPTIVGTKLARSAWLGLKVTDLTGSSARTRTIATSAGGTVTFENVVTASDPTGGYGIGVKEDRAVPPVGVNEARLGLSVPADKLDGVLTELAKIGTVSYRSSQSQDVTDTYIDTQARIQPAKDSINRVRALLVKATSLDQIVMLESELSRRQADLDSLQQRLAELDQRTTMSDVTVTLWTDATTPVNTGDNAFVSSLKAAWDALLQSMAVIVTGLAVLLPWLIIAAVVAWLVRRWRRQRTSPAASTD